MSEIFTNSVNAVMPLFLLMLCGYVAKLTGILHRENVAMINKVVFNAFIPVMVVYNIYSSDISSSLRPDFIAYAVAGLVAECLIARLLVGLVTKQRWQQGVVIQAMYRTSIALVGIQLLGNLVPGADLGPLSVLTVFSTLVINTQSVITLELYNGKQPDFKQLLIDILKNPLIIGCFVAIVLAVARIKLPVFVESTMQDIAKMASPLSLFLLGAFFQFEGLRRHLRMLVPICVMRLMVFPAIFLGFGAVLGFRGIYFASLIPVFATATAVPSFVMVQQMGGDEELAGDIVVATSFLSPLTIFFWCFLFQMLNVF